jgi:hypothetical protein
MVLARNSVAARLTEQINGPAVSVAFKMASDPGGTRFQRLAWMLRGEVSRRGEYLSARVQARTDAVEILAESLKEIASISRPKNLAQAERAFVQCAAGGDAGRSSYFAGV